MIDLEIQKSPLPVPEFTPFPSISRLRKDCVVTEKVDGTNAQIHVTEDGRVFAGSRNRWITPLADNFGFAGWVQSNRDDLLKLGVGSHFGEWWGSGIQRGYGLTNGEKRFALFNVGRWEDEAARPSCCGVVPVLYRGAFDTQDIAGIAEELRQNGSVISPNFDNPEGIVIYHEAAKTLFKYTFGGDGHKGAK